VRGAVDLIVAQGGPMAMGARNTLEKNLDGTEQSKWLRLLFMGVEGLPGEGEKWVEQAGLFIYEIRKIGKFIEQRCP